MQLFWMVGNWSQSVNIFQEVSKIHRNMSVRVTAGPCWKHSVGVGSLLNTRCKGNAARMACQSHETAVRLIIQLSAA